jgi:hypothetical protein
MVMTIGVMLMRRAHIGGIAYPTARLDETRLKLDRLPCGPARQACARTHATITANLSSGSDILHARSQASPFAVFQLDDDHTSIHSQRSVF